MNPQPTFFLLAGEASGDLHGSLLMQELKKVFPQSKFVGIGGNLMISEGLQPIMKAEDLCVVGLVEVAKRLPFFIRSLNQIVSEIQRLEVDAFIPIDFPDFNLRVAKRCYDIDVPVIYYICPQVWAWRKNRIGMIEKYVDLLLTIFPFEARYFSKLRLNTQYVGHPLLDEIEIREDARLEVNQQAHLAILPGSRPSEIQHHLPTLSEFIHQFLTKHPESKITIPCAQTLTEDMLLSYLKPLNEKWIDSEQLSISSHGSSEQILKEADAAFIASGTSTLQAVLCNIPFALVYKLNPITAWLARRFIKLKHVGLVNLVAEKGVCREFLQQDFNVENLMMESEALLWNTRYRQSMLESFKHIRNKLGQKGASENAAKAIEYFFKQRIHQQPQHRA